MIMRIQCTVELLLEFEYLRTEAFLIWVLAIGKAHALHQYQIHPREGNCPGELRYILVGILNAMEEE